MQRFCWWGREMIFIAETVTHFDGIVTFDELNHIWRPNSVGLGTHFV